MARDIIINQNIHETRVAVMEDGTVTELYHERETERGVVGNIYKGKVTKVLPGMESAFVDIGLEKASFLYIDDVRPDFSIDDQEHHHHHGLHQQGHQQGHHDNRVSGSRSHTARDNGTREYAHHKAPPLPIDQLLKEGQEILVQVSKGPIGTKGPRVTGQISLPGRNLVFMPTGGKVGVSRQIYEEEERKRLKDIVNKIKPRDAGFIIRTVAEGRAEEEFRTDVKFLISLWDQILQQYHAAVAPAEVYQDLSIAFRVIRDLLASDVRRLIVDSPVIYAKIRHFLRSYLPHYASVLELYKQRQPIFEHFSIEDVIDRAMSNKVWLKSGGYLVINQTEALTAVDVNTGRYVGKASHEETILKTNLEAVQELVYQLKLRSIGGIIIIDLIDMESPQNRQKVYQALKEELKHDKARSKILQISEMGLVEMTRKRDRENLERLLSDPCPYCDGTGRIKSFSSMAFEIFRELEHYRQSHRKPISLTLNVHPDLADYLVEQESAVLEQLREKTRQKINVRAVDSFHHQQFEIFEF